MTPGAVFGFLVIWLATYAIHSTLLLGGVWILERRRPLSPSLRDTLWKAALLGGLATATIHAGGWSAPLTGSISLPLPLPAALLSGDPGAAHGPGASPLSWPLVVVTLWGLGACLGVFHLGARQREFVRALGPRRPVMGPLAARLRELRQMAGIRASIRLTTSSHLEGPVALSSQEICLPDRALLDLDSGEQESVLAHELGHIARGDINWRLAALLLERVFFFQPLHRVARRGLSEAAEFLADDWAVARMREGMPLARCLAVVAGWLQYEARPALATEMAARDSSLLRRVERLVGDRASLRETPRRRRLAAAVGALVAVSFLAPGVTERRAPAPAPLPEAPLFVPAAYVAPLAEEAAALEALRVKVQVALPEMEARLSPREMARVAQTLRRLDAELRLLRAVPAPPCPVRIGDGHRILVAPRARQVVRLRTGFLAWS